MEQKYGWKEEKLVEKSCLIDGLITSSKSLFDLTELFHLNSS